MKELSSYTCPAEGDIDCPYYKNGYCCIDGNPAEECDDYAWYNGLWLEEEEEAEQEEEEERLAQLEYERKLEKMFGRGF